LIQRGLWKYDNTKIEFMLSIARKKIAGNGLWAWLAVVGNAYIYEKWKDLNFGCSFLQQGAASMRGDAQEGSRLLAKL